MNPEAREAGRVASEKPAAASSCLRLRPPTLLPPYRSRRIRPCVRAGVGVSLNSRAIGSRLWCFDRRRDLRSPSNIAEGTCPSDRGSSRRRLEISKPVRVDISVAPQGKTRLKCASVAFHLLQLRVGFRGGGLRGKVIHAVQEPGNAPRAWRRRGHEAPRPTPLCVGSADPQRTARPTPNCVRGRPRSSVEALPPAASGPRCVEPRALLRGRGRARHRASREFPRP